MMKRMAYLTAAIGAASIVLAGAAFAMPPPGPKSVDCDGGDTIQEEVDEADGPTIIFVSGTCTENVTITKDDITIQGDNIDDDHVVGGFTITGAHRVTIKSLTIRDGTTSYPVGVFASRGAAVVLDDIFVSGQGGAGIYVSRNAYADIFGSTVESPDTADNALLLNDGAVVRASNSTFISANGDPDNGAAVGLFRSSSARFDGDVFFWNTAVGGGIPPPHGSAEGGGLAVQVLHTSNLRVRSGAAPLIRLVNGDVIIGNNSAAKLREVDVGGDIVVERDSTLNLLGTSPVFGLVTIKDQSLLSTSGSVSIPSGVTCTGGAAGGVIGAIGGGGTITGCSTF
jgi:hypothetical protein